MIAAVDHSFENEEEPVDTTQLEQDIAKAIKADSDGEDAKPGEEEKNLAARLHLRYIKKEIEKLYKLDESKDWAKISNKVEVLMSMLKELHREGHKVLIFSKTKIFLNIIQQIVSTIGIIETRSNPRPPMTSSVLTATCRSLSAIASATSSTPIPRSFASS